MPTPRIVLTTTIAAALLAPTAAHAASKPGLETMDLFGSQPRSGVDAYRFAAGVALPDGGTVLAAPRAQSSEVKLMALRRDGSPDPGFGQGGTADVAVPNSGGSGAGLLRRPDGRLVLLTTKPAGRGLPTVVVTGLTATGTADPAFNGGRPLELPTQASGPLQAEAALAPDGGLLVTGSQGAVPGGTGESSTWTVTRLTADGAPDPAFGSGGTTTLEPRQGSGESVAVAPDGTITALGTADGVRRLQRVGPAGELGASAPAPGGFAGALLPQADGGLVVVDGVSRTPQVARYLADLTPDPAFHGGQPVALDPAPLGAQGLPAPDGGVDVVTPRLQSGPGDAVRLQHITPAGQVDVDQTTRTGLGGGVATQHAVRKAPYVPSLDQSGGFVAGFGVRPDGTVVLAGGVNVVQPTGEGSGLERDQGVAISLTPAGALDPAFAAAEPAPTFRLSVPRQSVKAVTDPKEFQIVLADKPSGPGLVALKATARGKTIARSVAPVFARSQDGVAVALTKAARRSLKGKRRVPLVVTATFRDLAGQTVSTTARGTLR